MNKFIVLYLVVGLFFVGCKTDADVASHNLSKAAEQFEINRRVVFYDSIQGDYIFVIEGKCSVETTSTFKVTCKINNNEYVKHYLGRADNVTWFAIQLETADVSVNRYKVILKPSTLLPDFDLEVTNE